MNDEGVQIELHECVFKIAHLFFFTHKTPTFTTGQPHQNFPRLWSPYEVSTNPLSLYHYEGCSY